MQEIIQSISISDEETIKNMEYVYEKYGYAIDPHTSVGYSAFKKYTKSNYYIGVILSTAHPSKFPEVMNKCNIRTYGHIS